MDDLLAPWTQALGTAPAVRSAGRDVLARYGQAHRRYHDRVHLAEVLAALRTLAPPGPLPVPVVCAAYWHDAVYDGAADDEQRSADLAARVLTGLGTPPHVVDEVVRLVLLTVTHDPAPDDGPGALLCDADLAVLAADEDRYLRYAQGVREEYAHVDDGAFRDGRSAVLRTLLARPRLYATEHGRRRWEQPARRNLQAELTRLAGAPDGADRRPSAG